MELLQRFPLPRRLAARVWLLTIPSGLLSFERRQRIPKLPIGNARLLGLGLIAAGIAAVLGSRQAGPRLAEPVHGLSRFRQEPAVVGGLLALTGVGVLMRSLVLIAYALGLGVAFARDVVELEEPRLPGGGPDDASWDYDETRV